MYYDDGSRTFNFLAGLVLGAAVGAVVALLLAPGPGRTTRRRLRAAADDARSSVAGQWDHLSGEMRSALEAGRRRLRTR